MFSEERLKKIKAILLEQHHVEIKTLSALIPVSDATIRRDLDQLEKTGFLIKRYGGATINNEFIQKVTDSNEDFDAIMQNKALLGLLAADLVEDGDVIFIGAGNTCWQITKYIKEKKNLTVVTNSFSVVLELQNSVNIKLIFLGGDVEIESQKSFTSGRLASETLKSIYIQKSFITVNGISRKFGYSINNHFLTDMYSMLLQSSNEIIVVADQSKFEKRAFRTLCDFDAIHTLVTNQVVSDEFRQYCEGKGIKLVTNASF
jgi:DeoR/GlpR family transcriptional regulator of sugar metabolism